jgi:hypothetical protein
VIAERKKESKNEMGKVNKIQQELMTIDSVLEKREVELRMMAEKDKEIDRLE